MCPSRFQITSRDRHPGLFRLLRVTSVPPASFYVQQNILVCRFFGLMCVEENYLHRLDMAIVPHEGPARLRWPIPRPQDCMLYVTPCKLTHYVSNRACTTNKPLWTSKLAGINNLDFCMLYRVRLIPWISTDAFPPHPTDASGDARHFGCAAFP